VYKMQKSKVTTCNMQNTVQLGVKASLALTFSHFRIISYIHSQQTEHDKSAVRVPSVHGKYIKTANI